MQVARRRNSSSCSRDALCPIGLRPNTVWHGCRVFDEREELMFFLPDQLIRRAVMCPAFGAPNKLTHYLHDTAGDGELYLPYAEALDSPGQVWSSLTRSNRSQPRTIVDLPGVIPRGMLTAQPGFFRHTNDKSQSEQYYDLLDNEQRSTDDFQGPLANQTNLAIKGIIGLKIMSVISDLLGKADKADEYKKYGASDSWGTAYNIFADKLLNLQFIPQEIYDKQNAWYKGHLSDFGLQIWTAAMSEDELKNKLIDGVARLAREDGVRLPFGDKYDAASGNEVDFPLPAVISLCQAWIWRPCHSHADTSYSMQQAQA
ncbi:hypothetical protein BKA62DRAFT_778898 [Auriculariales sp. MPI-PUGE-AT-0066]|nr:hypothetical protein BKA62DRAFT_778898 [Auriculariales sp. MPI-PUGE-AT-0066]